MYTINVAEDMKQNSQENPGSYEREAVYYDAVYEAQGKDYKKESNQIHEVVQKNKKSKGNRLLDIGCGTGGHFPYLQNWYSVQGLDLDGNMLSIARQRHPDIAFYQANMTNFELGEQFDAVTCLFSAVGYTKTPESLKAAINTMGNHLKPGGVLVVEPWFSPDQWKVGRPSAVFIDKPDLKMARINVSEQKGNISVLNFHFLIGRDGNTDVEYFTELHELGLFTKEEYFEAFKEAGLETIHDPQGITGRGLYIGVKP